MALLAVPARRCTGEGVGISIIFFLAGLWFASWAGRLSVIYSVFDFNGSGLGAFLACMTAGSLAGLSIAPTLIRRIRTRKLLVYLPLALAACLVALGLAISITKTPSLAYAVLFAGGVLFGSLDVTMNVYGAGVERRQGRSLLPSLHGFFSLGTLAGAGVATVTISLQWCSLWHFALVALLISTLAFWAVRQITHEAHVTHPEPSRAPSVALRHPRRMLLLLGLMVAGLSFTEGAANDWLAVATHDGHGFSHSLGALMFTVFVAAMALGRFTGGGIVDRLGAVRALLLMGSVGLMGVALFITGSSPAVIALGALLWGLGSSLGFPVGMSIAASRSEHLGPRAVSIISGFGYGAMLSGPPLVGFLADYVSVLPALWLPALVLLASLLITPTAGRGGSGRTPRDTTAAATPDP